MKISGFIAVERLPKVTTSGAKCRHFIAVGIAPITLASGEVKHNKYYLHATKGWRKA